MQRLVTIIIALPLLGLGCSAQNPDGDSLPGPDAGAGGFPNPDPDPDPQQKPSIDVGEVPAATEYMSVPISGTGPASGTVIVETATESVASDIGAEGNFCIDVPLQQGIVNTLWFRAMDVNGVYSDEVEITVRQEGEPPDGDNEEEEQNDGELRNIAELGQLSMNLDPGDGNADFINDGDPTTMVEVENHLWAGNDHLMIKLTDTAPLDHVRVRSADDCPIKHYHVLITDEADPGEPPSWSQVNSSYYNGPWEQIEEVEEGAGDETIVPPFQTNPVITHVALLTRTGCSGTWDPENFKILEVEAFTQDEAAPPTTGPQGPSCAAGAPE